MVKQNNKQNKTNWNIIYNVIQFKKHPEYKIKHPEYKIKYKIKLNQIKLKSVVAEWLKFIYFSGFVF